MYIEEKRTDGKCCRNNLHVGSVLFLIFLLIFPYNTQVITATMLFLHETPEVVLEEEQPYIARIPPGTIKNRLISAE